MNRDKNVKSHSRKAEGLNQKIASLNRQLAVARKSIRDIKAGKADALVIASEKELKVYAEQSSDHAYRILIEKMNEGAAMLNARGIILYCNSHFAAMAGKPLQKVIGTKFNAYIDGESDTPFAKLLKQRRSGSLKKEALIRTSENDVMPVLMSINTLLFENRTTFSVIITDLTVQNRNQEELRLKANQLAKQNIQLENANKDLTTFAFISSHDLQEPLRKIQMYVSLLLKEDQSRFSDAAMHYFKRLGQAADRMRALIDDLLTYSRTKSEDRTLKKTDLHFLVVEVGKEFEAMMTEKHATVETSNLGEINVITIQFRQLIHNLISNSLKFSQPGIAPRIRIKMDSVRTNEPSGKRQAKIAFYHIAYSDNGIGFEPKYNARVFEVFQRLHGPEKYEGTGMGLAICKRIVENHNGIITASGKLGKGVRFDIYIPVSESK